MKKMGRAIPVLMILLQVSWLVAIDVSGSAANASKIRPMLFYSLVASGFVFGAMTWPSWTTPFSLLQNKLVARPWWRQPVPLLAALFVLVGVVYARFQRVWPWDEQLSFQAAEIVAEGGIRPLLQQYTTNPWLGAQHPPGMMLVYGLAMRLFYPDLFVMRMVVVLLGSGALVLTYLIGRELYGHRVGVTAVLFWITFPLVWRQSAAAMMDMPVTFFFVLVMWLVLRLRKRPSYWLSMLIALAAAVGLLVKYTMALVYPLMFVLFWLPSFRNCRRHLLLAVFLPLIPLLGWLIFAQAYGILPRQLETLGQYATLMFTNDLVRSFALETFTTRLPSALGPYNLPVILAAGVAAWRKAWRQQGAEQILISWIGVVSLLLTLTLPDHRYFMLVFPALAVLMAAFLEKYSIQRNLILVLALFYCAGALYLFIDWFRTTLIFLP